MVSIGRGSPQLLHIDGAHGTEGRFLAFVLYFLGDSVFLGGSPCPSLVVYNFFYAICIDAVGQFSVPQSQ